MWPIKEKENEICCSYCGQILSPITSCRNESLLTSSPLGERERILKLDLKDLQQELREVLQ